MIKAKRLPGGDRLYCQLDLDGFVASLDDAVEQKGAVGNRGNAHEDGTAGLIHRSQRPGPVDRFGDNQGYFFEAPAILPGGRLENPLGVDDEGVVALVKSQSLMLSISPWKLPNLEG